jgi:cytoskeleton protein RodZ
MRIDKHCLSKIYFNFRIDDSRTYCTGGNSQDMSMTLGEKLRQAREERGISISEVAEQTRISPMYLESIENDNYKPLPGGIFNKGFVKSYAKYVGIDENEALQDYTRLIAAHEEVVEEFQPRYRPEVLTDDARSASSVVPTVVFAGIILALMTGGILFVVSYIKNQPSDPSVTSNVTNSASNIAANMGAPETNTNPNPVPDQIRVEFKVLAEKVSVTSTVDGNLAYDEITPETPKTYTAQEGLKLRYYRGFADRVQILLNGKQIAAPAPPPRGNIEIEINRENVGQIFESGQIGGAQPTATVADQPSPAAASIPPTATTSPSPDTTRSTPRPTATTRPAFTPAPTPRRSPTPIIVGRPPATRPSPN